MNISTAIVKGAKILKENFISTANIDSEILMAKAINKDRKYILLNSKEQIDLNKLNIFKELIKKRSNKKPIAYLTNKKFFWNSEFYLTENILIPRPDTELIVENVLRLTENKNKLNILDIGIGSGCILLSILKERKNFYGTGIDVSKNCINISKINAKMLNVGSRLKLLKSNPPYINNYKIKYLDKDVALFEPRIALDGGLDGLSEIRKVIKKSSELIKKNGKFILEIGYDQRNKIIKLLKEKGFYINSIQKEKEKNDRCIVCTKV